VEAGTRVTFKNNSGINHTVVAQDGSWSTPTLEPSDAAVVTFDKPGMYTYICKEHPWSYGQIIVVPKGSLNSSGSGGGVSGDQATRGKTLYAKSCSNCHVDDLSGRDPAPALAGDGFLLRWQNRTVRNLFDKIRTTMPLNASDRLSDEAYLDIVAYLMKANDLPSGGGELKADAPALSNNLRKN
jgi:hypothetical protein